MRFNVAHPTGFKRVPGVTELIEKIVWRSKTFEVCVDSIPEPVNLHIDNADYPGINRKFDVILLQCREVRVV
jgi:hypothetical protein